MKLDALRARLREGEVIESPVVRGPRRFQIVHLSFEQSSTLALDWSRYPSADFGVACEARGDEYATSGLIAQSFAPVEHGRHNERMYVGARRRREVFMLTLHHTAIAAYRSRILLQQPDDEVWIGTGPDDVGSSLQWSMPLKTGCFSTFQLRVNRAFALAPEMRPAVGWKRLIPA